jgi:hypothetical protein
VNKDQPYQYSKSSAHPQDESGWAAAGAGLQSRTLINFYFKFGKVEETIASMRSAAGNFLPSFL